jgi:mRNA-degrading endonuclease toxin of MazEF toxin-antitoxin module
MTAPRGAIVYAAAPFKRGGAGRPWVIVNTPEMPFHGEQYVALALTTRTWYEERLSIADDDLLEGGLPEDSSILPWAVGSIDPDDIDRELGRLDERVVDDAVRALASYLGVRSETG